MKKAAPQSPGSGRLLLAVFLAAEALALSACIPGNVITLPGAQPVPVSAPPYSDSLVDPVVVRSVNGVLDATLDVVWTSLQVPTSDTSSTTDTLRSYMLAATTDPSYANNDPRFTPRFPGPTFRVQRGDLIRIKLNNKLPPDGLPNTVCQPLVNPPGPIPDVYQACFHGPNYTNIHYHGMHVTPESTTIVVSDTIPLLTPDSTYRVVGDSTDTVVGDDVLMVIAPGTSIQYSFRIPQNQSPGTHWYHPHKHGSVAIQVANGMSGAFIVEDTTMGLDSLTAHYRMREHLIGIQQIGSSLGLLSKGGLNTGQPLVNGQFQPVIFMAPGEVQRWRIVNENVAHTTKTFDVGFVDQTGVEGPQLFDIARDGVQLDPKNYDPTRPDPLLHMAPGQRLDVFARAPKKHGLHLFQVAHLPGQGKEARRETLPARETTGPLAAQAQASPVVVFQVYVDSTLTGRNTTLPGSLPDLPRFLSGDLPAAADTAVIVFTDTLAQSPTQFYLGSATDPYQRFNDTVVFVPSDSAGKALPMILDAVQTWKIVNRSQQQISHPFHIHINPFQVDSVYAPMDTLDPFYEFYQQLNAASRRGTPVWLDVLPLPWPTVDSVGTGNNKVFYVKDPGYVFITQRYDPFHGCPDGNCGPPTGQFVMHCHILGHEERGMMQVLEITAGGKHSAPRPHGHGQGHGQHHHVAPGGKGQPQGTPQRTRTPVRKDPQQHHHH